MTNQNQSYLRFSLEESIWFQNGQEVSELISLSIEPEVDISEKNQYINIQGSLYVSGEYRGISEKFEEINYENHQNGQQIYVQNVDYREEDGVFLFNHTFPVDISIPSSRVENREAIEIDISSFDYNMPENSCIKLIAELLITGIYDGERTQIPILSHEETSHPDIKLEEVDFSTSIENSASIEESHKHETTTLQHTEESFEASAYALPREESIAEKHSIDFPFQNFNQPPEINPNFTMPIPTFQRQSYAIPNYEIDVSSSNKIPMIPEMVNDRNEVEPSSSNTEEESVHEKQVQESVRIEVEESVSSSSEIESLVFIRDGAEALQLEEETDVTLLQEDDDKEESSATSEREIYSQRFASKKEEQGNRDEESIKPSVSLTDFFANKEAAAQTKLKVCIVQSGESLSDLANRYSISKHEIIASNDLDDENDIHEGQVLYIPRAVVHK